MSTSESLSLAAGVRAFFSGIGFVLTTPRVWPYAIVPAFIMLVLSIGLSIAGFYGVGWLTDWIFGEDRGTWSTIGYWTVKVVLWICALLLALLGGLSLAQPLSSFALEAIARIREERMTGRPAPNPPFIASLLSSLQVAVATLVLGGVVITGLFILDIVFPPAMIVTVPLKFLVTAWLLAWNFVDYPLGLRQAGMGRRCGWVCRHFSAFTVFGLLWSLIVIIPGVVLLILPMGVAGATTLVVEGERGQAAGSQVHQQKQLDC
jgi:CysZ protein